MNEMIAEVGGGGRQEKMDARMGERAGCFTWNKGGHPEG
jgi:hypothetical protein